MVAGANSIHCTHTQKAEHKQEVQLHYMDPGLSLNDALPPVTLCLLKIP